MEKPKLEGAKIWALVRVLPSWLCKECIHVFVSAL